MQVEHPPTLVQEPFVECRAVSNGMNRDLAVRSLEMAVAVRPPSRGLLSATFEACRKYRILAVNDDSCGQNLGLIIDAMVRIYGKPCGFDRIMALSSPAGPS